MKITDIRRMLPILFLPLLALGGCSSDDVDKKPEETIFRLVSDEVIEFPTARTVETVTFQTNMNWTAALDNETWCTLSKTSGAAGANEIKVTASANNDPDDRNATLTLHAGDVTKAIRLTQYRREQINLSQTEYEVRHEGDTLYIPVESNVSYWTDIPVNWIKKGTLQRGLEQRTLVLMVAYNDSNAPRETVITLTGEQVSRELNVKQKYTAPSEGGVEDMPITPW